MHLWTDYEGKTIAGYLLGRLNRSEGRSAFFTTVASDGQRALLRLTEAHFDEAELIGRWRRVADVSHVNLQAIKRAGQTTFEDQSLACCLLESTDSSLADVLRERILTTDETKEVAETTAGALAALHAAGLIHEHVDASNVFAAGEVIKLRSDCCRECVGDFEADTAEARDALRKRDVHDLGLLLLRCLGQEWQGSTSLRLPSPLDRIIPGALNGTLTAEYISTVLQPPKPAPVAPPAASTAEPAPIVATAPTTAATLADAAEATPQSRLPFTGPLDAADTARISGGITDASLQPPPPGLDGLRHQSRQDVGTESFGADLMERLAAIPRKVYIATGAAAAMLAVAIWAAGAINRHTEEDHPAIAIAQPAARQATAAQPSAPQPPTPVEAQPADHSLLASGERAGWHVIAYTYKYEQQAQAQVMKLQRKYINLHPQVFTPTGKAPYFVALGDASDEATAMDIRNRARRIGLPRDTFARNF